MRRRKLEKIESLIARKACFSKRRRVTIKKAEMLSKLCDVGTIFLAFSPTGRPFLHSTIPSSSAVDSIINKFINDIQQALTAQTPSSHSSSSSSNPQSQSSGIEINHDHGRHSSVDDQSLLQKGKQVSMD
ncbi:Transcription factor [Macleaya cordata]|uniref:Transcription factor n=1 Tax=Macleaya cordata TaxID=56857 RepID=A0A200RC78_MACCD|nr:Transcription factor [Macleaya cordata]